MVVGTLQENGIPEPVPQPEVDADGRVDIREHLGVFRMYDDLLHG